MSRAMVYSAVRHAKLINALKLGCTLKEASEASGIGDAVYAWRRCIRENRPLPHPGILSLLEEIEEAKGAGSEALVARINEQSEKDWRAAVYLLDRRKGEDLRIVALARARADLARAKAEAGIAELKLKNGVVDDAGNAGKTSVIQLPTRDLDSEQGTSNGVFEKPGE